MRTIAASVRNAGDELPICLARAIAAQDARKGHGNHARQHAAPHLPVDRFHRRGMHTHHDLPCASARHWHLVDAHDLSAAVAVNPERAHRQWAIDGSQVAMGGKTMMRAISAMTHRMNGAAARYMSRTVVLA